MLFEAEESRLKDAGKRQQKAKSAADAAACLRQESGFFFQDPFLDRSVEYRSCLQGLLTVWGAHYSSFSFLVVLVMT